MNFPQVENFVDSTTSRGQTKTQNAWKSFTKLVRISKILMVFTIYNIFLLKLTILSECRLK